MKPLPMNIKIRRLFGDRNIRIHLNPDVTIINAENGKGKTTILQFIYAILSGNLINQCII